MTSACSVSRPDRRRIAQPRGFRLLLSLGVVVALVGASAGSAGGKTIPGHYIVVLKDTVPDPHAVAAEHARAWGARLRFVYRHALKGYAARLSPAAVSAIEADRRVLFVSEDAEVFATSTCDPSNFNPAVQCLPSGIDRIDSERSSTRSGDGRGAVNINVAVLDSGINLNHPDLNVVGGVGCSDGKSFDDPASHGTHVAGTIGALDNGIGVVGVVPGARLWSVRVLSKFGKGTKSSLLCGIDWVSGTRTDGDPSNDVAVANMSLGAPGTEDGNCGLTDKDAVHLAICNSTTAGVTYVVAAGNGAHDLQNEVPAAFDEVLTVTAAADFDGKPGGLGAQTCLTDSTISDETAVFFSNFATLPADQAHTIAAPGVCIFSTASPGSLFFPGPDLYGVLSGTSQASPHVAGTVALCIASGACAGLTPVQIIQKIVSDAAAYNTAHPAYGFSGDPLQPEPGKYFGFLIRAGLY